MTDSTTAPIALITGASRGIGRLLAQKLGQRGVTVVVTYKGNADLAEESLADVKAAGGDGIVARSGFLLAWRP